MNLGLFVCDSVTENETAAFSGVTMQVDIYVQFLLAILVDYGSFCSVDCRVAYWVRLSIHSIQVKTLSVISPITAIDAIWVQTWHNLENKPLK